MTRDKMVEALGSIISYSIGGATLAFVVVMLWAWAAALVTMFRWSTRVILGD